MTLNIGRESDFAEYYEATVKVTFNPLDDVADSSS